MEMENNTKNTKIIIGIIIAIALVVIGYGFYRTKHPADTTVTPSGETTLTPPSLPSEIVNAKHQFINGKHTYVGEFDLPSPCHGLSYDIVRDSLNPQKIEIVFTTTLPAAGTSCTTVITPKLFKVTFEAPEKIQLTVTRDGKSVLFNIFEVPVGQNIDTYSFEVKG